MRGIFTQAAEKAIREMERKQNNGGEAMNHGNLIIEAQGVDNRGCRWTLASIIWEGHNRHFFSNDTLTLAFAGELDEDMTGFDPATYQGEISESTEEDLKIFGLSKEEGL